MAGMHVVAAPIAASWAVAENLGRILGAIAACEPGDLAVFPEGAPSGYDEELSGLGSLDPHVLRQGLDAVAAAAAARGVRVALGTLWPGATGWQNAAVLLDPQGGRQWYRKVNLAQHERTVLAPGGVTVGIQLCRELRYPEQWRWLAVQGAEVLLYLTHAVDHPENRDVWRSLLVSRAAENQRYVVAVNAAHPRQTCPSAVIDPGGRVLAEVAGEAEARLRVPLDLTAVSDWYLGQARADLVRLTGQRPGQ